ncbi:LysR family transcriptional regulator [Paraburkholderia megapolitana]|uniref:Transcriptional regulator, LysR family n=1 Tax=Paraburkholderia megapolitana TaxID=420953 RepID=A0A1I3GKE8_9BURK|nr:LysR family transcriptional regulator [Paraburkholderia megapolitana]QDQ82943.1 LysR family transcriptional regulator [Paraburkholderia megapolitana]SFI23946.1 transcriptional regulator, LysR family [Paraburkholderia megapolitana]
MNDLRQLVVFAETVSHGSMSAAAIRLGMTPSAVSQTIKALERQAGVTLLHRSTRKLTLTEDGKQCYAHCLQLMASWKAASDSLSEARDAPTGELRIAAPLGLGPYIAPALASVLSTWPQLRLRLLASDDMVDLIDARVDLAIRIGNMADSDWTAQKLCELETILCASPAYLARNGTPKNPQELSDHQWITLEMQVEAARSVSSSDGAAPVIPMTLVGERRTKQTVQVSVRVISTTQPAVQQMCEEGLGIACLSYIEVLSSLKHHNLVHILPKWALPTRPVTLVTPRKDGQPAKVRAAVEALRSYFRDLPTVRPSSG